MSDDTGQSLEQLFGRAAGEERFINFAEKVLGVTLSEVQEEILRAVHNNKRLVIVSGNGVGKTFVQAVLELSFLYSHQEAMVMHTSRSNSQIRSTTYKEVRQMLAEAQEAHGLPGISHKNPMEIVFEGNAKRKYEAVSPSDPDGLEGRHAKNFLMVVDEADKAQITDEVIESAQSTLTDGNDRMVVFGNPPRDKDNSLYRLMESKYWELIQFSSFDSDNVRIAAGEMEGEIISGPIQLDEIMMSWDKLHDEEWPGYEAAKNSGEREDLADSWYRRRLGVIPPESASKARPFFSSDVGDAKKRWQENEISGAKLTVADYDVLGIDIAGRGNDSTVIVGATSTRMDVLLEVNTNTETANENMIRGCIGGAKDIPIIFDTVGLGAPVADTFRSEGYNIIRFDGNVKARDTTRYYNKRTEAYGELGSWLKDGAIRPQSSLLSELYAVSENMEYHEKALRSGTSWIATPKSELKKASKIGKSPDYADAASMAAWGLNSARQSSGGSWSFHSITE